MRVTRIVRGPWGWRVVGLVAVIGLLLVTSPSARSDAPSDGGPRVVKGPPGDWGPEDRPRHPAPPAGAERGPGPARGPEGAGPGGPRRRAEHPEVASIEARLARLEAKLDAVLRELRRPEGRSEMGSRPGPDRRQGPGPEMARGPRPEMGPPPAFHRGPPADGHFGPPSDRFDGDRPRRGPPPGPPPGDFDRRW